MYPDSANQTTPADGVPAPASQQREPDRREWFASVRAYVREIFARQPRSNTAAVCDALEQHGRRRSQARCGSARRRRSR